MLKVVNHTTLRRAVNPVLSLPRLFQSAYQPTCKIFRPYYAPSHGFLLLKTRFKSCGPHRSFATKDSNHNSEKDAPGPDKDSTRKQEEEDEQSAHSLLSSENCSHMTHCNGADIYIVGSHLRLAAAGALVSKLIQKVQPQVVVVELDKKRWHTLEKMHRADPDSPKARDFFAAVTTARKFDAEVVFGDDEQKVILKKMLMSVLNFRSLFKFLLDAFNPIEIVRSISQAVEKAQNPDRIPTREEVREIEAKLRRNYPDLHHVISTEREQHFFDRTKPFIDQAKVIVIVVGMAHMDNLERLFLEDDEEARSKEEATKKSSETQSTS